MNDTKLKIETKNVKHTFTMDERNALTNDLLVADGARTNLETEFDSIKQNYRAKIEEAGAKVVNIMTSLRCGFELRGKRCAVVYRPADRKKDYFVLPESMDVWPETVAELQKSGVLPAVTEDMTGDDFQAELLQAESRFEAREEIPLWKPVSDKDASTLVVGRLNKRWFCALRLRVGAFSIDERLDSEQVAYKMRSVAVEIGAKRATDWLKANVKGYADGFKDAIAKAVEAHKERVE